MSVHLKHITSILRYLSHGAITWVWTKSPGQHVYATPPKCSKYLAPLTARNSLKYILKSTHVHTWHSIQVTMYASYVHVYDITEIYVTKRYILYLLFLSQNAISFYVVIVAEWLMTNTKIAIYFTLLFITTRKICSLQGIFKKKKSTIWYNIPINL